MGRKLRSQKRQTRLTFDPVPADHEVLAAAHPATRKRAAFVGYEGSPVKRRRVDAWEAGDDHKESSDSPNLHENDISKNSRDSPKQPPQNSSPLPKDDSDGMVAPPRTIALRNHRRKSQKQLHFAEDGPLEKPREPATIPWSSSPATRQARESRAGFFGSDAPVIKSSWKARRRLLDSDDEDDTEGEGCRKRIPDESDHSDGSEESRPSNQKSKGKQKMKQSSKHGSDAAGDGDSDTGHDEADDDVPSLKRSRSAVAVNPEEVSSDEDDIPVRSSALKRRQVFRRPSSPVQVNSDSDEEEVEEEDDSDVPRSARRRGTRLSKQPRPSLRELWEEADLAEDLEFLESSPPPAPHSRGARSSQATPKKSKKLSALEELRRRRQRQIEPSANLPVPLVDEDEDEGLEEEEDAEIVDYNGEDDVDEEDFIVEDDPDDPLGAPEMPLQFTRMGTAKAKDLFQHAVAWMVHKKLNARFRMDDEIYQLTFRKLSDEVKGLAGSKFMSSIWRPDFTRALRSRPGIIMENVGIEAMAHCEACNRKSHPATWTVRFEGKPYDPETLDELYLKDSSSSSEDDEEGSNEQRKMKARGPDYDAQGNELPPERKLFYVGVHCKANATTAHTLTHWKIHLYEWVVDYLAQKGHLAAEKIVDRDSWSDRKKEKFANRVAKGMVDDGEVKRLYRDFHHNVDDARDAKQQYGRWGH